MEKDNIQNLLNEIDEEEQSKEEEKEVVKKEATEIDASDADEVANALIGMTLDDRSKADKLFDLFYDDLAFGKDRSTSSKEAISRALELKIDAGKNLIDLLKIRKGNDASNNILINAIPSKKSGIDLSNIKENLEGD